MKKLIVSLILIAGLIGGNCYAEIPTNWVTVESIHFNGDINKEVSGEYYPLVIYFDGTAVSEDSGKRPVRSTLNIGTPKATPFDLKTLEGQKEFYQALPANLKPMLKDLGEQATGEDISQ